MGDRMKAKKPEKAFEEEFGIYASMMGCQYVKIPDVIMTKDRIALMRTRGSSDEIMRPFDGVLVTPDRNFCIELKFRTPKLRTHQDTWQSKINRVNNTFFVCLKKILKSGSSYSVIKCGAVVFKTDECRELIKYFINWGRP